MDLFAHIFFGNEFGEIVSNIGKQVFKHGGENYLPSVNLFLVNDVKLSKLEYPDPLPTVAEVLRKDARVEPSFVPIGEITDKEEEVKELFVEQIFNQILNIDNVINNTLLHVVLHFPLYKPQTYEQIKKFYKVVANCQRPVKIDFFGYCDDMVKIIEPDFTITHPSKKQIANFEKFKKETNISNDFHFVTIQNMSQNGIALGLNKESLSTVLGYYVLVNAKHYDVIFPNTAEYKDVVTFGISTLYLDKYLYAEYLMNKTILNTMDRVHVNEKTVDVNAAYQKAHQIVVDKMHLLSKLFEKLDKQPNHNPDEEFPVIQKQFADEIQEIVDTASTILSSQDAITMQAAILAVCLAKTDCELYSNTIFTQDIVTLDSLFDEPINYMIESDKAEYYKIDDELPVNPIPVIKELDNKLVNAEAQIRTYQERIKAFEEQIDESQKVTKCYIEDGFVHFENQKFRLLPSIEQEPLAETYTPHEVQVESLDLRSKFTGIKNQGQQGSCLSFTLTSIFEYVMQLNHAKEFDLSEAFLYYNARDIDNTGDVSVNTDTGSRFKPAIDSLVKYGIALEKVWPYNDQVYSKKPSEEAYTDAAQRKLIAAMNVNLTVKDIKSALVDGCPVASSFVLTKSFFENHGGYIPMPSDEEIAAGLDAKDEGSKHSQHAMVIVGFSDELQMFIVRNSWGIDWGDKGYCYIPYTYIENPKLFNFACIITEIENLQTKKMDIVPPMKVNTQDLAIQCAIDRQALYIEEKKAEQMRQDKLELRAYFETLKGLYINASERDNFIAANRAKIEEEQELVREEKRKKEQEAIDNEEKYALYKKQTIVRSAIFAVCTTIFAFFYKFVLKDDFVWTGKIALISIFIIIAGVSFMYRQQAYMKALCYSALSVIGVLLIKTLIALGGGIFTTKDILLCFKDAFTTSIWWLLFALCIGLIIIAIFAHKRWKIWREERDRIERDIQQLTRTIQKMEYQKNIFKLKAFASWTLLNELYNLHIKLYKQYTSIISLINNLRTWYREMKEREEKTNLTLLVPENSLLSEEKLNTFFEEKIKNDPNLYIDFCADMETYQITEDTLKKYKENLIDTTINKLLELSEIQLFNITDHITNKSGNSIANEVTRSLLSRVRAKSNVFMNIDNSWTTQGVVAPFVMVFAPSVEQYRISLTREIGLPLIDNDDANCLIYFTTSIHTFRECVNFN